MPVSIYLWSIEWFGQNVQWIRRCAILQREADLGTIYRDCISVGFSVKCTGPVGLYLVCAPWAEAQDCKLMAARRRNLQIWEVSGCWKVSEYSQVIWFFLCGQKSLRIKRCIKFFCKNRRPGNVSIINAESCALERLAWWALHYFENGERVLGQPGTLNYVIETVR